MSVSADSRPIGPGAQQASTRTGASARPASRGALAVRLPLGVARRAGYLFGIVYTLLVWSVGEGFGGPYGSGSTDVGTGIILAILFAALYVTAPSAAQERLSLDRTLVTRWTWWRLLAEPHAADRR